MTTTIETAPDKGEVTGQTLATIAARTGLPESDIKSLVEKAGIAALAAHLEIYEEITVPLALVVVPSGKLPVFMNERTVRYHRAVADVADVDADEYVSDWLDIMVKDSLDGSHDVTFAGITQDMVDEFTHEDGRAKTAQEKEELYDKLRGLAYRYQQELKQETAASVEGGAR